MAEAAAPLRGRSNSLQRMLELERQYMVRWPTLTCLPLIELASISFSGPS